MQPGRDARKELGNKKSLHRGISGGGPPGNRGANLSSDSLKRRLLESRRKGLVGMRSSPTDRRTDRWNVRMKRLPGAVTHEQQLRTWPCSEGWLSSESLPQGLSVTRLSSHQRRSCWGVALTLPLDTTFHCIPGEGRRPQNLGVGKDVTEDLGKEPPQRRKAPVPRRRVVGQPLKRHPQ